MIETDGPWPYGGEFEGRPTEPTFLGRVVQEVATIKGVTTDEVAEIVTENAVRLFRLQSVH